MKRIVLTWFIVTILGFSHSIAAQEYYLDVSPNSQNVGLSAGSTTFTVDANVGWNVTDDASWLTATKTDGSTITVTYDENTSTSSRTANITASGTGGVTETVTLTQAGVTPYLDVDPNSQTVCPSADFVTFNVDANVGWNVTDDADWLTATKTDGSTITATYEENTSTSERTAHITATGTGGVSETVTVTQITYPFMNVSPSNRDVSTSAGSTTFSVTAAQTDWTVTDDAAWLTATKSSDSTITVTYEENTSTSGRIARITVTPTGSLQPVEATVTQAGATPYLDVSPNSQDVGAAAGSTTFTVSSSVGWSVTDDADWLTATKTDGSTISVTYDKNPDPYNSRTAHITATGTGGVTETVTLTQSANKYSWYLSVIPTYKNVSSESGSTTFSVVTNLQWSVTDDADWLDASKSNDSTIFVSYDENTSPTDRTATITVTGVATGGGLDPMVLCTVTQAGTSSYLVVSPDIKSVGTSAGSTTFSVSSNKAWSVTDDADWLTATKSNDSTISVTYDANSSTDSRKAYIEATSNEAGLSVTATVIQAGTSPYLDVSPDNKTVDAAAGSATFSVSSNVEWSVTEEADWLTATKTGAGTLTVTYDANTSTDVRGVDIMVTGTGVTGKTVEVIQTGSVLYINVSPNNMVVGAASGSATFSVSSNVEWSVANDAEWLTVTKTDGSTIDAGYEPNASIDARTASFTVSGTGGVADTVTITQEGEYIYLHVDPDSIHVSADSGSATFTLHTNVDAMEWSIEEEVPWLTAIQTGDSIISISYEANTATDPRAAFITAFVIYAEVSVTLKVTQDGATAYLEVSPDTIHVSSEAGSATFTVLSNIEWLMNEEAAWLSTDMSNDTLVTVNYEENPSAEDRSAIITLSGEGVTSDTVIIEQSGIAVGTMIDLSDDIHITIYPNPSSEKIYLRTGSDIHAETAIALYDGTGKILYVGSFDQILSREIIEIDLSALNPGTYMLQLKNATFLITRKIVKN